MRWCLAQERRPRWLVLAAIAFSLALHAHPTTIVLAPIIAIVAISAMPSLGALLRWGTLAVLMALLRFAPPLADPVAAPAPLAAQAAEYVGSTMRASNLLNTGPLLWGMLVRGPRVVSDAFGALSPGMSAAALVAVLALELSALAGLAFAAGRQLLPVAAAISATLAVVALIAWLRPATPFYMIYALLPFLAGLGALGLYALCAGLQAHGSALLAGIVGLILALYAACAVGIAATIAAGDVTLDVASRLDVKRADATPALAESWLPAHAIDASGALLCGQRGPIVLHGCRLRMPRVRRCRSSRMADLDQLLGARADRHCHDRAAAPRMSAADTQLAVDNDYARCAMADAAVSGCCSDDAGLSRLGDGHE